jgi:hypothetical protein
VQAMVSAVGSRVDRAQGDPVWRCAWRLSRQATVTGGTRYQGGSAGPQMLPLPFSLLLGHHEVSRCLHWTEDSATMRHKNPPSSGTGHSNIKVTHAGPICVCPAM